ncbi:unnamed protein product [Colias eurytheme]|nr:unnamed protein product [Colias eurytheme]
MINASDAGCSDYIIRLENPVEFMVAFDKVAHKGLVRRSDKKVIILPSKLSHAVNRQRQLDVLSMKETNFIVHILLVIPISTNDDCEAYDLVTHKFVGVDHNMPIYLDRWNACSQTFETNSSLFPQELSNLEGKVVKVAGFTYKPYVLLDLDTNIAPYGRDGVEIQLMDEFCRWVNCTMELVENNGEEWGEIYENFTGLGVLGRVVDDRADFGIAALYSWYESFLFMDFSVYSVRTAVTCIAPSPRLLASWTLPLMPFSSTMWIGLIFTFLYASLALFISQKFSSKNVFFITFGLLITQSQSQTKFQSWRIRSVVIWVMLIGLVLDNAYGGGLAATFTVPKYEPSIDTIQDIVDRKLPWGATHDAWVFSLTLSQEPLIKQLIKQFHTYEPEELQRLSFTREIGFSIEKLPAGYFAIGEYITEEAVRDFTLMLQDFYFENCVVMMRKSSPYTNKINEHIGRLHESGLMLAWETQMALKYLDYKVQLEVKLSRSKHDVETIEPLHFRHVLGIFIIYVIGVLLATLAFMGEILKGKKK